MPSGAKKDQNAGLATRGGLAGSRMSVGKVDRWVRPPWSPGHVQTWSEEKTEKSPVTRY